MKHLSDLIGARPSLLASAASPATTAHAQASGTTAANPAASSATAPAPAASRPARRAKRRAAVPVGDPGVAGSTGGTPEASSRTPGGPPPGMKTGITFPLPSIGGDGKK